MRSRVLALCLAALAVAVGGGQVANAAPTELFFSEYIEGSSNNKALEIYNGTGAPINLGTQGYNVQMFFNGSASAGLTISLLGTVAPGDVFVLAQSTATQAILDQADQTNGSGWFNGDDAVVLRKLNVVIDSIGQVGVDPGTEWGTGLASTADNTLRRKAGIEAGDGLSTDAFDPATEWLGFATDTFNGLGCPGENACGDAAPSVSVTSPLAGATNVARDANVSITFSEPVTVTDPWYSISCATSGLHTATQSDDGTTFTLDPTTNFASSEQCTVTVTAANVADQDTSDPPDHPTADYTFSFQTAGTDLCGDPATKIGEIQGEGASAAKTGNVTVEGVVVGDFEGTTSVGLQGFYLQDTGDGNPATSDGIFVFTGNNASAVTSGEVVRVTGFARERFEQTSLNATDSNTTPVTNLVHCGTTATVTATDVTMPFASLTAPERYEGMLVRFPQSLVMSEYFNYDQFGETVIALPLDGETRAITPTAIETPGAAANARMDANALRRITLDDGLGVSNPNVLRHPNGNPFSLTNLFRGGDLVKNVVGVLGFDFSRYRIQPTAPAEYTQTNPRPAAPHAVGGTLRVAAQNTLNYFVTADYPTGNPLDNKCGPAQNVECRGWDFDQPTELDRQKTKLIEALAGIDADVLGLNELENTTGVDALTDPTNGIVPGLNAKLGAGTYAAIETGVIGTDAIRVGLIYKPAKVRPVGDFKLLTSAVDPRFIDTRSRPALAQTFEELATGARFTVAVNHLKSKGSACADIGDPDVGDGQGNCNVTRTNAAKALVDWLATDPTGSGDPDFLIIGDLNSYAMEDPITAIKAGPDDTAGTPDDWTNLVSRFIGPYAYSYVFDGMAGYLDHALANPSLNSQVTGVAEWHINADEADVVDYDTTFKPAGQEALWEPNQFRVSDHDPIIVGLRLNAAPSVDGGGPYTVDEGGSVSLTATGSDPNGDALTYAWDLDNNGTFETSGQTVTFSAATIDGPATRTVGVRVSDGSASATDTAQVTILNAPPTATFDAPATVFAGNAFTISLTNATDAAPADRPVLEFAFDCGNGYGLFGTATSRSCPTDDTGTITVRGKVRDDDGGVTEYTATVRSIVTVESLSDLVRRFVESDGIENAMLAKLREGSYSAFANQVDAQRGKALTPDQADLLIRLVGRL